jgi:hypothetical protein
MDFFIDGSSISFIINSWSGVFLLFYLVIEIVFIVSTKMSLTHKLLIAPIIIRQLKKQTPKHWSIGKIWHVLLMNRTGRFRYELYIEFYSKLEVKEHKYLINPLYANDFITVNTWGKIIKSEFKSIIQERDTYYSDEVKQLKRDIHLKDLGL